MTPMLFCQNFYIRWHFFSQVLHTLNKDTHVDHFWCLISKYTEYDNIFINWNLKFCNKSFHNAYQVKFSRKLLGKRVQTHVNIKSVTLSVQSVRQPWTRMLAVAYESSSGQPLPQVSEEGHSRSSPVSYDTLWLLMAYCRLHFLYETAKCWLLCYRFNSETCWRRYLTDAMILSFNRMALQLTAHAMQDWNLYATAVTLLWSMNGHQTRQILTLMCGVPCWKPITSWTSKPSTTEEPQTRIEMIWNDFPRKPVARDVQNFRKRLQACNHKAYGHFEHSMWLTLC